MAATLTSSHWSRSGSKTRPELPIMQLGGHSGPYPVDCHTSDVDEHNDGRHAAVPQGLPRPCPPTVGGLFSTLGCPTTVISHGLKLSTKQCPGCQSVKHQTTSPWQSRSLCSHRLYVQFGLLLPLAASQIPDEWYPGCVKLPLCPTVSRASH
jgi:hypothetical protein